MSLGATFCFSFGDPAGYNECVTRSIITTSDDTHLAEVAERLVKTLFEMTRPQANLAETPQPDGLLAGFHPSPDASADSDHLPSEP